ncbi:hypothetical protein [Cohnella thailandensis]|uniref:Uncharacterized protein n=1 Tax=Cohnella thailandensis TaxID=557557 RepID=A0A841SY80_9BACL|nr:hypothetical protein [Cohnella thailandensis]MBB6633711.1 hypothetical protein [Cohnella thailandensis]MBP1976499.1 hypothetical protein [Cohnella thailandensis]
MRKRSGAAAYLFGDWDRTMAAVVSFRFLYFAGSVFFVKSVFRERKNRRWTYFSYVCRAFLLALPFATGFPWMSAAYLISAARFRARWQTDEADEGRNHRDRRLRAVCAAGGIPASDVCLKEEARSWRR